MFKNQLKKATFLPAVNDVSIILSLQMQVLLIFQMPSKLSKMNLPRQNETKKKKDKKKEKKEKKIPFTFAKWFFKRVIFFSAFFWSVP